MKTVRETAALSPTRIIAGPNSYQGFSFGFFSGWWDRRDVSPSVPYFAPYPREGLAGRTAASPTHAFSPSAACRRGRSFTGRWSAPPAQIFFRGEP